MIKLKLTAVGEATGVELPEELLAKLQVREGDTLYALETPRGVELTPYRPDLKTQVEVAEGVMSDFREALHRLAG
jgi:putative addiction module antidote